MHSRQYIEENRCFSNVGTNLHIHTIAQGRPEDNQVEFLQGPHGIVNRRKNLVLNNIRRFTMEHIGAANGLHEEIPTEDMAQAQKYWMTKIMAGPAQGDGQER